MRSFLPQSLFRHLGTLASPAGDAPARVTALVVKEEEKSERLIGWVQLTLASVFLALYLIAPKPVDADPMFEPVPLVIISYIAFTLVRIVAAYTGYLPGWLLVVSMLADVALLYGLIWSFHIVYAQPPAFYLKVPTFAYVFVFIAIRALRFDPRFVLSQGLFAAFGWILMVLYAMHASGMESVTRSFVTYLTSNLVMVGAEFDKIFTILALTAVLSLALFRARRTLNTAVRESVATREMRRFFGTGVADAITSGEHAAMAGDATDRDAAILMLDLRGFSAFAADCSPRKVVSALTAYHALTVPLIEAEGGVVDKFLGDGLMATFGAVEPSNAPAAAALRALDAVMAAQPRWEAAAASSDFAPLPIHGAAVAGRVVAATLGHEGRLEFTVIGEPANLAAKLEKHNKALGTRALTTAETLATAIAQGYSRQPKTLGAQTVPGVTNPVALVALA